MVKINKRFNGTGEADWLQCPDAVFKIGTKNRRLQMLYSLCYVRCNRLLFGFREESACAIVYDYV